jgi:hypothetical protein
MNLYTLIHIVDLIPKFFEKYSGTTIKKVIHDLFI